MYQQMEGQYIHQSPFTFFTTSISLVMFAVITSVDRSY